MLSVKYEERKPGWGTICIYDSWPSCGRCTLKSLPSTRESRNLRQGVSSSQNKALPATGVCPSLKLMLLTSHGIPRRWIATRCFTSYVNIVIASYKISPYTARSRGELLQGVVLRLASCVPPLCVRFGWLMRKLVGLGFFNAVGHYLASFTANEGLKVS